MQVILEIDEGRSQRIGVLGEWILFRRVRIIPEAAEPMALLNGSAEENMEKVCIQRWLACYTDGFEAWSIARKSGYPAMLTFQTASPVSPAYSWQLSVQSPIFPGACRFHFWYPHVSGIEG